MASTVQYLTEEKGRKTAVVLPICIRGGDDQVVYEVVTEQDCVVIQTSQAPKGRLPT